MIVLDTNVISEEMRAQPNSRVHAWLLKQPHALVCTTAVCQAEMLRGITMLPIGKRRAALELGAQTVISLFTGRILPFDSTAALHFADIMETRRRAGRRVGEMDAMIAAIARSRGYTLATRNSADFNDIGVTLVDPWQA